MFEQVCCIHEQGLLSIWSMSAGFAYVNPRFRPKFLQIVGAGRRHTVTETRGDGGSCSVLPDEPGHVERLRLAQASKRARINWRTRR
jgi:hypothetical protein